MPTLRSELPPVALAVPAQSWMYTQSAMSLLTLSLALPRGSAVRFAFHRSSSIAANREQLAQEFLRQREIDWLLWCDSDMVPTPAALTRLLAAASTGKDFVSASYFGRVAPYSQEAGPLLSSGQRFFRPATSEADAVQEAEAVGLGFCLMHRRVFERMAEENRPFFEHPVQPGWDEDFYFCQRARASGTKIYVDLFATVGHMGANVIDDAFAKTYQLAMFGPEAAREYREGAERRLGEITSKLPHRQGRPATEARPVTAPVGPGKRG